MLAAASLHAARASGERTQRGPCSVGNKRVTTCDHYQGYSKGIQIHSIFLAHKPNFAKVGQIDAFPFCSIILKLLWRGA